MTRQRECLQCGCDFEARRPWYDFCSEECSDFFNNDHYADWTEEKEIDPFWDYIPEHLTSDGMPVDFPDTSTETTMRNFYVILIDQEGSVITVNFQAPGWTQATYRALDICDKADRFCEIDSIHENRSGILIKNRSI